MWNKIGVSIKDKIPRAARDAFSGVVIDLLANHLINDSVNSTIEFLANAKPDEIMRYAIEDKRLVSQESLDDYRRRLRDLVSTAKKIRILNEREIEQIKGFLMGIDVNYIMSILHEKAEDRTYFGEDRALKNLGLIINSPICIRWLNNNLNDIKNMVIEEIERTG